MSGWILARTQLEDFVLGAVSLGRVDLDALAREGGVAGRITPPVLVDGAVSYWWSSTVGAVVRQAKSVVGDQMGGGHFGRATQPGCCVQGRVITPVGVHDLGFGGAGGGVEDAVELDLGLGLVALREEVGGVELLHGGNVAALDPPVRET